MADKHYISSAVLDIKDIEELLKTNKKLALSEEAKLNINKTRKYLEEKLNDSETPFYGINTGFGSLDRKSTRLNSSHVAISYAVFCLKKKTKYQDLEKLADETAEEPAWEDLMEAMREPGTIAESADPNTLNTEH